MCAVVLCKTEKEKRDPHPTQTDITVNAESTGHRPTTDLGPHDLHPKVQTPIPNSPYSPDTPLPTPLPTPLDTVWCQRPDTVVSAPRHVSAPTHTATAPRHRPDTAQHSARYTPTLQGSTPCGIAGTWNRRYAQRCRLCLCVRCGLDCALRPILRVLHAPR